MFEDIDPDLADRHESDQLKREERRAEHDTWLSLHDNGDGTFSGRFTIPELHGQLLTAALERLTAPRRLSRDRAGRPVVDETAVLTSRSEAFGAGFCELLEHLPSTGHAGSALTVMVTLDLQHLLDGIGAARLDTGVKISAGEARRLACEAGLVPAVLGGASTPLDLGRTRRLHSRHQHQASTTAARSPAATAPSPGARSTTRSRGPAGAAPTSTTGSRSAAITAGVPTTPAGTSGDTTPASTASTSADRT
jgi:hypothetical protein